MTAAISRAWRRQAMRDGRPRSVTPLRQLSSGGSPGASKAEGLPAGRSSCNGAFMVGIVQSGEADGDR